MKLKLTIVFFLTFIFFNGNAQDENVKKVKFGIKGGLNMAVLSGTVNMGASFKPGFHFGGFLDIPTSDIVHIQPELYFSSQGSNHDDNFKTNLNYINIPLLIKIYAGKSFNFQLGPQLGLLVSAKYKEDSKTEDVRDAFKGADFSISAGFGLDVSQHIIFGGRLNYGVSDIGNIDTPIGPFARPAVNNRVIQLFFGYSF